MVNFQQNVVETCQNLRLIDDILFRLIGERPEVCQEILQTLLNDKELEVVSSKAQETMVSLYREVVLDVLCKSKDGKLFNVEVQKGNRNNDIKRCRFHLSTVTTNNTPKGTDFDNIPDVVVVYITEYDALGNGQSVTCSEMCQMVKGQYRPVNDGAKVYYANPVGNDDGEQKELLELFLRKDAFSSEKFPNLSRAMKFYKEEERGVEIVCTLVQEYVNEGKQEGIQEGMRKNAVENALRMIAKGFSTEDIADITQLSIDEIEKLR